MLRVVVIGGSCAGKTTTARRLAAILDVPHIELDALHHGPNWDEAPAELLRERLTLALTEAPDGWVVDGNYFGKLRGFQLEHADTVISLDLPYRTVIRRVFWRTLSRLVTREQLWNGNRERLRDTFGRNSIVLWVLRTHPGFRKKWTGRLRAYPHVGVVRLRSQREVDDWLQSIQATAETSGSSSVSARQKMPPLTET